jgi:hypothetical protein
MHANVWIKNVIMNDDDTYMICLEKEKFLLFTQQKKTSFLETPNFFNQETLS